MFGTLRMAICAVTVGLCAFDVEARTCQAREFTAKVAAADSGGVVIVPKGAHFLASPIMVVGKTNLTIRGEAGATLVLNYSREGDRNVNNGAFVVERSRGVVIEGLSITTVVPTSSAGHIVSMDPTALTVDVKIDPEFPITGREFLASAGTVDENETPDWIIETFNYQKGERYKVLAPQLIRVFVPPRTNFARIRAKHRISFRHSVYCGAVFRFHDSHCVTVRDILIERCASMCVLTSRPCSDFVFERFNVGVGGRQTSALVSANADGIHPAGMSGRFVMRDCNFERMGDDSLNVHANAGYLDEYDVKSGRVSCLYFKNGKKSALADDWAKPGDRIAVYDTDTFLEKGVITIDEYNKGCGKITPGTVAVKRGDLLANLSDFPDVRVSGCTVRNTRARGFLLQSRNILIEDCIFEGTSLPGIIISPDARRWAEVGPTTNAVVRNCTFRRCGIASSSSNAGVVSVKASHDGPIGEHPAGVHKNVQIVGNKFEDCATRGIVVAATDGLVLRNNVFLRCKGVGEDVQTVNCMNVVSDQTGLMRR